MTGGNPRAFCSAARDACEPASHPRGAAGREAPTTEKGAFGPSLSLSRNL